MSINTERERQKDLIAIWQLCGPVVAKQNCKNISEMLSVEEISADYYLGDAKALVAELEGNQDMCYVEEKIRHLVEMMDIATKHTLANERWEKARTILRRYH